MPFRCPSEKEAFWLAVKDAHARGELGKGCLHVGEVSHSSQPSCALGWGYEAIGLGRGRLIQEIEDRSGGATDAAADLMGLTLADAVTIVGANDGGIRNSAKVDIEAVERAINEIDS